MKKLAVLFLFISSMASGQVHLVTNLNDSGPGSLRTLIGIAQPNDTVQFDKALIAMGSDTLDLLTPISITDAVVIIGAIRNSDTLFITSSSNQRAFYIDMFSAQSSVRFNDMAFVNFNNTTFPSSGGVILCDAAFELIFENCLFRNNRNSINYGGAIRTENRLLKLKNCRFTNNGPPTCGSSAFGEGGAIFTQFCDVEIDNCIFYGNSSCQAGGAISIAGGNCFATNSVFENNSVVGGPTAYDGGAILLNGASNSYFYNCLFLKNTAKNAGGALVITSSYGKVLIENSEFYDNDATDGSGGAISSFGVDSLFIEHCTFSNNHYNTSNSYLGGGACAFRESYVKLNTSTLYNNDVPVIQLAAANNWNMEILNTSLVNNTTSSRFLIDGAPNYDVEIGSSIIVGNGTGGSIETNMPIQSLGYNIFKDTPPFAVPTDFSNQNFSGLNLGSFQYNGGNGKTLVPQYGSIAYNSGDPNDFSAAQNSPIFGQRDIGAAERNIVSYDTAVGCQSYSWGGQVLTQSGYYTDTILNANSIDSVNTLALSLVTIDTSIQILDGRLYANERDSGVSYQWVDCGNGSTPVVGATDSVFTPGANGSYAVILTKDNCMDTSQCLTYSSFSIPDFNPESWLKFYPNPSNGSITFRSDRVSLKSLRLYSPSGKVLLTKEISGKNSVQFPDLSPGLYILEWMGVNGEIQRDRLVLK